MADKNKKYKRSIEDAGRISDEEYYNIMEGVAERNYKAWHLPNPDAALLHALNDNAYNYRGYYNKYPNGDGNAEDHWTDEFKTVYHDTFSNESRYSSKKSQYNPKGLKGGYWIGETFMPANWQRTQIGEQTFKPINWKRDEKKNGGVNYKVKKGDSLSKIAQQYTGNALRYNELAKLNGIENPDKIEIGQNIVIPKQFLDTIKDTNLQEVVVTGDKNKLKNKLENRNKLQNELDSKLKALTKRHVETPSTLRVQRIHNRSRSLEELNKPNFIERKIQDVKDVINESGNISDFFQTAWNGVAKNFVEDKKVTTKKRDIKINNNSSNNKIKDNTVLDENFAKEIRNGTDTLTWDRVPMDKTGNKYYIQESYPITKNMRFGARNRGDYTPLNSNNAPLTTYRPLVKYENNKTGAVDREGHENHFYGFDKEGKFKVGPLSEFGPGDTMTQAFYFDVVKVKRDKNGNIVYKEDRNNPGRFQPVVEGYDENTYDKTGKLQRGKYKESTITTMSKKRSLDGSYGNVSGGRVLLKADNETRVVSGSIDHVIQELELMQKNHKGKPVRYYQLDNGSYNRGLRTRNGKNISEQDLRDYDKQNTTAAGGGHFMYIRK